MLEVYRTSAPRIAVRLEFQHMVKFQTDGCLYISTIHFSMTKISFNTYSVTLQPQGIVEASPAVATPNYPILVILHVELIEAAHSGRTPVLDSFYHTSWYDNSFYINSLHLE